MTQQQLVAINKEAMLAAEQTLEECHLSKGDLADRLAAALVSANVQIIFAERYGTKIKGVIQTEAIS